MTEKSTKPIIAITVGYQQSAPATTLALGQAYVDAVIKAGGVPMLLPSGIQQQTLSEMLSLCDGLILTGGTDVDPLRFQFEPDKRAGGVDHKRDEGEAYLIQEAFRTQIPILGICRGIQILNVSLGGTLYIDLLDDYPGSSKHDFYPNLPRDAYRHTLTIAKDNLLFDILEKETIQVNSLHHQGIHHLAPNLITVGRPEDGSIEAVVATDHPWCIGVQWHPECLPEDQDAQKLFQAFIQAAIGVQNVK